MLQIRSLSLKLNIKKKKSFISSILLSLSQKIKKKIQYFENQYQYIYIYIYISKDIMLESMRLNHVAHSLKFSLFSILLQQSLHLY